MPAISARTIGTAALLMIGVASAEQPISAFMAQSALEALNTMLDSWSTERLLTWTRVPYGLQLVPGKGIYTWGLVAGETTPADLSAPAPVRLEICLLNVGGEPNLEWPLDILTQDEYERTIALKTLTSDYPALVYLEDTLPYHVLHVWPVPTMPYILYLLPWQAHSPYGGWDDVLDWPSGYARAMQYGLALELAPQYMVEPAPLILRTAEESKRAIFVINAEVGKLSLWPGRPVGGSPLGLPRGFLEGTR